MQVYNPNGTYVGKIQDVALPIGEGEISIQVLMRDRSVKNIEWSKIGAVGDIVILKENIEVPKVEVPVVEEPPQAQPVTATPASKVREGFSRIFSRKKEQPLCPVCGKPLTYIQQYQRWYCYNCQRYV